MSTPYTHGIWQVKPGRGDESVAARTEVADWTIEHARGTGSGKLPRDVEDESRFFTFGPWESLDAIAEWRTLDGWKERVERMRPLLDGFKASTLEVVVERG